MTLSNFLFKYRSYTPIPFLLLMIIGENASVQSLLIGFAIAVIGELIRFWGVSHAGSETRTTGAAGGTFLVISGPFAYVRNPLYCGNILMYTGIGIMSYAFFPYLQIAGLLFFLFQYHYIVLAEENYLRKTYGKDYEDFTNNVPRFFPRFTPYKREGVTQPPQNLSAGFKSEVRTLQAFGVVILIVLIKYFIRTNY